ncbi:FecR family protein [Steroidobacter sp.]|uniref:FecR family protein n=1 Tax=Steroidobacter sp. TaxID=1978227 RepID=UPI001A497D52|nr:FecR domain-containing protein [Steroidobacter sp.]MBL8267558.1 FecR domain-containing protein [Steroidobacter sp.]
MPTQPHIADTGISKEAARWIGRLEHATEKDRAAFIAWLRASPQHAKEFLLLSALEKEIGDLDLQDFDVDSLLAKANGNVIPLRDMEQAPRPSAAPFVTKSTWTRRDVWRPAAGLAAALLIGVGTWWLTTGPGSWQRYATAIGEQRAFELEDGSTIEMSPLSSVSVRMSAGVREVHLDSGEALFKVTHDPSRPFLVDSDSTMVKVLGTWFAVNRRSSSVTVSVLKGRVAVDDQALDAGERILTAGEEVKIMATGTVLDRSVAAEANSVGQRDRTLVFSGDTLAEIVEDFNRYNRSPQIELQGAALQARQFSGVFDARDPSSLVDSLARDERLIVERHDGAIIIRQKEYR